jgi:hypothetical protein
MHRLAQKPQPGTGLPPADDKQRRNLDRALAAFGHKQATLEGLALNLPRLPGGAELNTGHEPHAAHVSSGLARAS